MIVLVVFFFQAEDGIRDYKVTGVQTCALPICGHGSGVGSEGSVGVVGAVGNLGSGLENALGSIKDRKSVV